MDLKWENTHFLVHTIARVHVDALPSLDLCAIFVFLGTYMGYYPFINWGFSFLPALIIIVHVQLECQQ